MFYQALQNEGQDGGAQSGVISKLLQVAPVFASGPHGHLDESHHSEESHWHTLGHHTEADPRAQLICVVRTGNQGKNPCKRVFGWVRNFLDL